jgi:hypothetical protein
MAIEAITVRDPSRAGRPNVVNSMVMSVSRPSELAVAAKREPSPIGPSEMSSTCFMRLLNKGSLGSSATKSKTASRGWAMQISP